MTSRNIAIFLDGTWNEPDDVAQTPEHSEATNVWRLFQACEQDETQYAFYLPGVGTDIRQGGIERVRKAAGLVNEPGWLNTLSGGLLGTGLTDRVLEAYGIICSLYRPGRNDRLFIFGFSRGAFAARSLVNFIDRVGILFDGTHEASRHHADAPLVILNQVREAYALFEDAGAQADAELDRLLHRIFQTDVLVGGQESWRVRTHLMGLWDTVATCGLPWRQQLFRAARTEGSRERVPASVVCARHALAAHEFRSLFEPLMLWEPKAGSRAVEQRWFPGSHADVGGGYPAAEAGLAVAPLHWIADAARQQGLRLRMDDPPAFELAEAVLHQEGDATSLVDGMRRWSGGQMSVAQLAQIRARRGVRRGLRLAMLAPRLALRPSVDAMPQADEVLANADHVSPGAVALATMPPALRHPSWCPRREELQRQITRADRCLRRLAVADARHLLERAVHERLLDDDSHTPAQGRARRSASLRWALAVLDTDDVARVSALLTTAQPLRDHLGPLRRKGPPLLSRLTLPMQCTLCCVLMLTAMDVAAVNAALATLEAAAADPQPWPQSVRLVARLMAWDLHRLSPWQRSVPAEVVNRWVERLDALSEPPN